MQAAHNKAVSMAEVCNRKVGLPINITEDLPTVETREGCHDSHCYAHCLKDGTVCIHAVVHATFEVLGAE